MSHTVKHQKKLLNRIRKIIGQAKGLEKALIDEVECTHFLQQVSAIRGAMNSLALEVLEGHIIEHLGGDNLRNASELERDEDLKQLMAVLKSYLK